MLFFRCFIQHVQLEVESPKYKHFFRDYHTNVAPHEVASVDEKVLLALSCKWVGNGVEITRWDGWHGICDKESFSLVGSYDSLKTFKFDILESNFKSKHKFYKTWKNTSN